MKKSIYTPRSQLKSALRRLWLRSRERSGRLKYDGYSCQECGVKQSTAKGKEQKVQVHHREGVLNWDQLMSEIYKYLLPTIDKLITLCPKCHDKVDK